MPQLRPFERDLFKAMSIHLFPKILQDKPAFGEVLTNELFGLDGPRYVSSEHSKLEFDLWKVYRGSAEIGKSIATLQDIAFYLRAFPHSESGISSRRYLQFHAEAYLSEVYILRERMTALIKVVQRQLSRLHAPADASHKLAQRNSPTSTVIAGRLSALQHLTLMEWAPGMVPTNRRWWAPWRVEQGSANRRAGNMIGRSRRTWSSRPCRQAHL